VKYTIIITNLFLSVTASATLGGVDVGNGKVIEVDVKVRRHFLSERDLVNHVENQSRLIKNGEYMNIKELVKQHGCSELPKVKDLEVSYEYPINNGLIGKKEYNGILKLELVNCNK